MNTAPYSVLLASLVLAACAGGPGQAPTADGTRPVTLRFAAQVNGQPFECGRSYAAVGTTASTITPSDFRMYVSDVHLIDAAGREVPVRLAQDGVWQLDNIALLDFENGAGPCRNGTQATNTTLRGTVPAGTYTSVRLTLGVPFARNHGDPTVAPAPLNSTAMFWTWQGGYKFLKFDTATKGRPELTAAPAADGGGSASGYSVHLGSTMCTSPGRTQPPGACQNPNRVTVRFDRFDIARNTIVADIGAVLKDANVDVNAPNTSPGCMSFLKDADCPPVMSALGLAYEGRPASGSQRFLRLQ